MKTKRVKLGWLLLLLMVFVALSTLASSFYASYQVQRQMLINNTLESNHIYAVKLAASTENFLLASVQRLAYSSTLQSEKFDDQAFLSKETERLLSDTNSFNSVVVVDSEGFIRASAPKSLGVNGIKLDSVEVLKTLESQQAKISKPFVSVTNNLIVSISDPVFKDDKYLGYVGGAIYLNKSNILYTLLEEHYYKDGSYIYVIDSDDRILYHPDKNRIGDVVKNNSLIEKMKDENDGSYRTINSKGVDMLAGFATIPSTEWKVIAQRPVEKTLAPLKGLIFSVIIDAAPIAIITFLLIWWLAAVISRPLEQLATQAQRMNDTDTANRIEQIKSWYFESSELKNAMLAGLGLLRQQIDKLNHDVETDPMTGLYNRRSLESQIRSWAAQNRSFSVVSCDVDFFKHVNDHYGHDAGDNVLKQLATVMRECSREKDLLYRVGGEEFLMLLPDTTLEVAETVAERLRAKVEKTPMNAIPITVSLGVAAWKPDATDVMQVIKLSDQQLYKAKAAGRNCVRVHRS